MIKRMVSWGLIFSLLLTLLPVSTMAMEGTLPEDGQLAEETAQCSYGAPPDVEGTVTHAEGCPLVTQEEPALETEEPSTGAEEPTTGIKLPAGMEKLVFEALTPPVRICGPLAEENSSDMVLTV